MSQETVSWAKEQRCGDPVTKAVLMEIANWAKPTGVCEFLAVKRIADVVEVSARTVQRHIARLEDADPTAGGLGLIRRVSRFREDGGIGANSFELIGYEPPLPRGAAPPRQSVTPPRQNDTGPRQDDASPRQIDGEPGDTAVTRLGDKILPPTDADASVAPPNGNKPVEGEKPAAGAQPAKPPRAKREAVEATPLPDDWAPPRIENLPEMARQLVRQWPRGAYEASCEMFRLHWENATGSNGRKKNWTAAHAKWLIKDHPEMMRAGRAGVSFAQLAPAAAETDTPAKTCDPVPEQMLEGGMADGLRAALRRAMKGPMFDQWIAPAALLIQDDALRVVVRSAFTANYIEGNLLPALLSACEAAGLHITLISAHVSNAIACRRSAKKE